MVPSKESIARHRDLLTNMKKSSHYRDVHAQYTALQQALPQYNAFINAYAHSIQQYLNESDKPAYYQSVIVPIRDKIHAFEENVLNQRRENIKSYSKHLTESAHTSISANPMKSDRGTFTFSDDGSKQGIGLAQYTITRIKEMVKPILLDGLQCHIQINDSITNSRTELLSPQKYVISLPSKYTMGDVAHEMGHVLELYHPGIMRMMKQFQASRTRGENYQLLSKLKKDHNYMDTECCRVGGFPDPYCGKVTKNGTTEVFSMGLEFMLTDPVTFAHQDPEYFQIVMDCIHAIISN